MALIINSPGGDGLAAERIINVCRAYSGTSEFWAIVPGKAKSAATMVCLGASKIIMGPSSELGPIDPQVLIAGKGDQGWFSAYNIVKSYDELFSKAVAEHGNLQPYIQQLANYDEREIKELRSAIALSEDIAVRKLALGMMSGKSAEEIKAKIGMFLTPERTKVHGRPIYAEEAKACGLNIETLNAKDEAWKLLYELYIRSSNLTVTSASKLIEVKDKYFVAPAPSKTTG